MSSYHPSDAARYLTTHELAERWRCGVSTLVNARSTATSKIPWIKVGHRVLYALSDIQELEAAGRTEVAA